ncbi:MAG: esterase, partial [Elusimicrobia bacterium]|nr:esterase [Elusimicrobiota bacterium]
PNPRAPLGFDVPVDLRTGERRPLVWKHWEAHDPALACVRHARSLLRLQTIWFDAGKKDEFFLQLGARRLSDALKRLRIRHSFEEHDGGHFGLGARLDVSLSLLTKRCARVD